MEQVVSAFSQRMGFQPFRKIQADSMDEKLRNDLWTVIYRYIVNYTVHDDDEHHPMEWLSKSLWVEFNNKPIDEEPAEWSECFNFLKDLHFTLEWYRVYDMIEFIVHDINSVSWLFDGYDSLMDSLVSRFNDVLKDNLSGYRFVTMKIVLIINEHEINTVVEALNVPVSLAPVNLHLKTALDRLADKPKPDYRNSIKESVSAVESLCALLAGKKTELKPALREIEKKGVVQFHPALKEGFERLYGYTSDADGIRHALIDEPNLDVEDEVYMLVTCSAFINYLVRKAEKAGIEF